MKTVQYLDAIKKKLNLPSDYALQIPLGVTKAAVSKYRNGQDFMGEEVALRVAEILNIHPGCVLADMALERSKSGAAKQVWKDVAKRFSTTAGVAILSTGIGLALLQPVDSQAKPTVSTSGGVRIMSNRRRKFSISEIIISALSELLGFSPALA